MPRNLDPSPTHPAEIRSPPMVMLVGRCWGLAVSSVVDPNCTNIVRSASRRPNVTPVDLVAAQRRVGRHRVGRGQAGGGVSYSGNPDASMWYQYICHFVSVHLSLRLGAVEGGLEPRRVASQSWLSQDRQSAAQSLASGDGPDARGGSVAQAQSFVTGAVRPHPLHRLFCASEAANAPTRNQLRAQQVIATPHDPRDDSRKEVV